jgi:hypothetical protein
VVAVGLTVFTIGLAKKVLVADVFADYATVVFDGARDGLRPSEVTPGFQRFLHFSDLLRFLWLL